MTNPIFKSLEQEHLARPDALAALLGRTPVLLVSAHNFDLMCRDSNS